MSVQPIWSRLILPDGSLYPNTDDFRVFVGQGSIVDDLKTAVWKKNEALLRPLSVVSSGLIIYRD
jgi:hypothetical protein